MSVEWGSVSSWVGAVLTSGSLGLGFSILIRDRKERRRDQAATVSAVWDRDAHVVRVHNTSKQAIYSIQVFPYLAVHALYSNKKVTYEYKKEGLTEWQGHIAHIEPESFQSFEPKLDKLPGKQPSNVDVLFIDSRGQVWGRTGLGKLAHGYTAALFIIRNEKYPSSWFLLKKNIKSGCKQILRMSKPYRKRESKRVLDKVSSGGMPKFSPEKKTTEVADSAEDSPS
jgi:hypothetical protein